ncbi:hypothetical protein F5887DRAFT_1075760 [Amanita rubescens]|nr:hypothetical protein F5887DRAFT_1075760 [Amanita rubescens]
MSQVSQFNAVWHCTQLLSQTAYIPSADFDSTMAWKYDGASHLLVNVHQVSKALSKLDEVQNDTVMVIYTTEVTTTKFQLLLGSPSDPKFAVDFTSAVNKLCHLQATVALSVDRRCNDPIPATLEPISGAFRSYPKHSEPILDPRG